MKDIFFIIEFGPSRHARFNGLENKFGGTSDDGKNISDKENVQDLQLETQLLDIDQQFCPDIKNVFDKTEEVNLDPKKQEVQTVYHHDLRREFVPYNSDLDTDEEPGFCGGSKEVWKISYEKKVEEIKKNNPELSPSEVRHEAVLDLRLRHRADRASMINERSNLEKYEATKFMWDEKKGVRYKGNGYDTGIEDFHTRQQDFMPEKYSLDDHLTSKAINEAFRNGATTVVTSYHREGKDHRDILIMNLDPITKEGTTTVINTAVDGNFHTFDGIIAIAKEQFSTLKEMHLSEKTFLLVDKEIPLERIQHPLEHIKEQFQVWNETRNVKAHKDTSKYIETQKNNFSTKDGLLAPFGTDRIIRDISLTKKRFDQFRKESSSRENIIPKYPYQLKEKQGEYIHKGDKKIKSKDHSAPEVMIQKVKHIETQHKKMLEKKVMLGVIKETNVGIAASVVFLREIAKQPIIRLTKKEKKMFRKMERKNRQYITKEHRTKSLVEKNRVVPILSEKQIKQKKEKRIFWKKHIQREMMVFSQEIKLKLKKEKKLRKKERREKKELRRKKHKEIIMIKTEKKYIFLFEQWKKIARRIEKLEKRAHGNTKGKEKSRKKEKQLKKKEHIFRFVETFLLFALLKKGKQFHSGEKEISQGMKEKKNYIPEEQETPWVLLSIIWYMTMIREQGMVQYHTKKKKKKPEKKKRVEGVIFDRTMYYSSAKSLAIML